MLANRKLLLLSSITRHDILNKLSGIYGYLGILRMKFPDPALADYISKLEDTTKKIQALIAETQVYQDLGTQEPKWQELDKIARDVQVPATIALIVDLQGVEVFAESDAQKSVLKFP